MLDPKTIRNLSRAKAEKLERLIEAVEKRIETAQTTLTKSVLQEFLEKLTIEQGKIKEVQNRRTVTLFNQAYKIFQERQKEKLVKSILGDINEILEDNGKFYTKTVEASPLTQDEVKKIVNRRLGIDTDGNLIRNGYMSGVLEDSTLKTDIQKYIFKEIFKGVGYEALKEGLKMKIEGDKDRLGMLQRHYKTFSYDVYAQLNSYTSKVYADKLGLFHFIYNGGIIKTSRAFCKTKNGKVFSNEEAEQWVDDPTLTAIDSKETYDWLIDRGGYNCRHTIDFISKEIAFVLRPDLKEAESRA
ncbi:hypothetical protein [Winogradskyella forsetii]|uniref:hypothetical protein n=1 Tax=Winogradskyella forsetii TaxID=2686077 RepID=UPI0015BABD1E|nr:hypothetical protein [Winogradskyella forsetii]